MRISSGSVVLSKDRFYAEDHNEKENLIIVKNNKSVKLSSNSERSDRLKKLTEDSIFVSFTVCTKNNSPANVLLIITFLFCNYSLSMVNKNRIP